MEGRPGSAGAEASKSGTAEHGPASRPAPTPAPTPAAHAQRMSFEQFRAQEPPQSRLLRLRGLFDLLLDRDSTSALAGGRAKQYWRRNASRARYGAGGSLATGSLVAKAGPVHLTSDGAHVHPSEMHESVSPSNYLREWFSNVRRQSYANELLAQCRTCHAEMERTQRKMHEEQEAHRQRSRLGRFAAWWSPNDRPAPRAPHASAPGGQSAVPPPSPRAPRSGRGSAGSARPRSRPGRGAGRGGVPIPPAPDRPAGPGRRPAATAPQSARRCGTGMLPARPRCGGPAPRWPGP